MIASKKKRLYSQSNIDGNAHFEISSLESIMYNIKDKTN